MLAVTAEAFVPDDHPLRRIKPLVDSCLARLSPRFEDDVREARASLDPARAPCSRGVLPDRALLGAQRAPVLRDCATTCSSSGSSTSTSRTSRSTPRPSPRTVERLLEAEVATLPSSARWWARRAARRLLSERQRLQRGRDASVKAMGRRSRATARGTNRIYRLRRALGATRRWTSGGSVAAARRTCHAQTPSARLLPARERSRRRS